jgi:N-acetylglucosamine-6-sulfatase
MSEHLSRREGAGIMVAGPLSRVRPHSRAGTKRVRWKLVLGGGLAAAAAALGLSLGGFSDTRADAASDKPNVVLLLTDDQTLEEMSGLPGTSALIGGGGVTFNRAYISYPLCCPARASILSGLYTHNHGVRGNDGGLGGWQRFRSLGTEARALPTWLKGAGYYNVHLGKYMNGYGGVNPPVPAGWDEWYGKLSDYNEAVHGAGIYFNYSLREDPPASGGVACPSGGPANPGDPFTCHYGERDADYQTDVIRAKAVEAIHRLSDPGESQLPFFLSVSFNAPHSPYLAAPRHSGAFAGAPIPPPVGSNEKSIEDKPRFLRRLPRLGYGKLARIAERRRIRLAMLLSVDETVSAIAAALSDEGQLDNTYLIFTSDNGYFNGEHRIRQGKYLPHDPSSHVPLLIRGPGLPAGASSGELVSDVDLADTIRDIAGAGPGLSQDGRSLLPFARDPRLRSTRPILLEADTGPSIDDEAGEAVAADRQRLKKFRKKLRRQRRKLKRRCRKLREISGNRALACFKRGVRNLEQEPTDKIYRLWAPAYRAIRTDRYLLTLYSNGEVELYDMARDPAQLHSLRGNRRYRGVRKWLLARLSQFAACAGPSCSAQIGPELSPAKRRKRCTRKRNTVSKKCRKERHAP